MGRVCSARGASCVHTRIAQVPLLTICHGSLPSCSVELQQRIVGHSVTDQRPAEMLSTRRLGALITPPQTASAWLQDMPHAGVGPEAALVRQLQALQGGDLETAFAFASPANRRQTGPLERFAALLESPIYRPLVRHQDHEVRACARLCCRPSAAVVMHRAFVPWWVPCRLSLTTYALVRPACGLEQTQSGVRWTSSDACAVCMLWHTRSSRRSIPHALVASRNTLERRSHQE